MEGGETMTYPSEEYYSACGADDRPRKPKWLIAVAEAEHRAWLKAKGYELLGD